MKNNKSIYIETYGCQMNFSDSEIVASILKDHGYDYTEDIMSAGVIFVNTCSILFLSAFTVRLAGRSS